MRLAAFLLLVATLQANANATAQKITIAASDIPLEKVLMKIKKQSGYAFFWKDQLVSSAPRVSVQLKDASLTEALDACFRNLPFAYKIENNFVYIFKRDVFGRTAPEIVSALITVNGIVTNSHGQPLARVSVTVKGSGKGTTTDAAGAYSISVEKGDVLQFSFIGYKTTEIVVGNRQEINVSLSIDVADLSDVVVVGYGKQRKVNLTGSVSTINYNNEFNNRPITNASQALGGTVTGVWVSQNSGQPGSDGAQLRVRGWGTLNNSNPLIIIDGVEGKFSQINPNDIESISVLKDASSAAIYGSKAANGVVLVTTKMGETNQAMKVNLNSYFGIQSLGRRYNVIGDAAEHMEIWNQALVNEGKSPLFPDYMVDNFRNADDPYKYPSTNFYETFFRNSPIHQHNLSFRGGSEKISSFLSFNYLDQEGITPAVDSRRYGVRANITSKVNDWLKLSGRFNYNHRKTRNPYTYYELWVDLATAPPFTAPYTRDGRFGASQAITNDGITLYDTRNPFIDAANGRTLDNDDVMAANVSADIKLTQGLLWTTTFATTGEWSLTDKYNTTVYGYTDSGDEVLNFGYNRGGLEIGRNQTTGFDNNFFSTLTFDKQFAAKHDITTILGVQMESLTNRSMYARRTNPPKEGLTQVDAGTDGVIGNGNMSGLRIFSYFGRFNYTFDDKYLFEANLRADASSRFAKGNRWGVFPGFSAGWRVSQEEFLKSSDVISNLKLRASWGQLGNQNVSSYWPYLTVIDQTNGLSYTYGDRFAPGAAVTALVDENITWETSTTFDVGVDVGFWNERLTLEADYFNKITSDIIVQLPIPTTMGGLTPPFENVGKMSNKGVELLASYNKPASARAKLGYSLGLNVSYVDNKVTKFRGGDSPDQLYLIREGYSYRTLYGYKVTGIYQTDEEAAKHMHANGFKPKAGNLKIEDVNEDGRLDYKDQQELGNTIPKFTYGFTSRLTYKGFDLNILLQGIAGVHAFTRSNQTILASNVGGISTRWRDAWTPEHTDTKVPSLKFDNSWDNSNNSYWVQDISFIKLKNIQLGYSMPGHLTSRLGIDKLYFYVNAQNVFTIVNKDYEGFDPERNTFDNGADIYPIPRIFSFGINLNF